MFNSSKLMLGLEEHEDVLLEGDRERLLRLVADVHPKEGSSWSKKNAFFFPDPGQASF